MGIVPQFAKTLYTARGKKDATTIKKVKKDLNQYLVQDINL